MRKFLPVFLILMILGGIVNAFAGEPDAKYKVVGIVADSLSMEPEPYATIRIYRSGDSSNAVAMLISDDSGHFSAKVPALGDYTILITSVGKSTINKPFTVTSSFTDLGTLLMSEDVNALGEVSVVAKKPLVKVDMDKIAYDVAEDPESESKTVLDMLRKVPMVSVDGEGNISLVGKSSFKIYLNGKPSNMITNNPKEVLRGMPATSVKNIEVITNPGVKYDAEGVGGIINIVTTGGGSIEGYSLDMSASYMKNNGYSGSLYGTTKIGKFSVSGNYGYTQYNNNPMSTYADFEYFNNPDISRINTVYDNVIYNSGMHNFSIDTSYELDSLNLFSMSGSMFRVNPHNSYSGFNETYNKNNVLDSKYDIDVNGEYMYGGGNFSFDYQHMSPKRAGEMFVFSYRMDRNPTMTEQFTNIFNGVNYPNYEQHLKSHGKSLENTFQADYTFPFKKIHTLNFGAKYIYRINDSKNEEFRRNSSNEEWEAVDRTGAGDNIHRQHVFGAYTEYNLRYKKFGLKGGLRYEFTSQNVKFDNYNEPPVNATFSDVVPSLLLSYTLGDSQNLTLGYNMRINRPGIYYLNPFRDSSQSPYVLQYGNPDLETERYNSLTFGYGMFTPNFSVSLNFDYSMTNNAISSVSFVKDNKINYTYANIGRNHTPMLNLYTNWNPSGSTRLTLNGTTGYQSIKTVGNLRDFGVDIKERSNNGIFYNVYCGVQQNLPWKLNLNVYGGGGCGGIDLYIVEQFKYYFYGIQLQRSFLKDDKLSVSLSANSFAPKYFDFKTITQTDDYRQCRTQRTEQFNYSLSISYKIGNFRSSVKKAAKTIRNTDVVGGSSGANGGMSSSGKK